MNGYSRIKKHTSARSKSVDFADLSLTHLTPRNICCNPKLSPNVLKIATMHESIPEQDEDETGEVFGIILSRKCSVSSGAEDQKVETIQESSALEKRQISIKRSASVSEGCSRIHHQADISAEDDENSSLNTNASKKKKKKGKILRVFKRFFGL